MTFQEQLDHLIIEKKAIPDTFVLPELIEQKTYLSDGELVTWDGPRDEVFSPICMHTGEGTLFVVDALRSFSIRSLVAAKLTEENKHIINDIVSSQHLNFLSTKFIF